jgi:hypothetical protein
MIHESRCCNYRRLVRRRFSLPLRPRARKAKPPPGGVAGQEKSNVNQVKSAPYPRHACNMDFISPQYQWVAEG